jgi:hypothetical protein
MDYHLRILNNKSVLLYYKLTLRMKMISDFLYGYTLQCAVNIVKLKRNLSNYNQKKSIKNGGNST